MRWLRIAIRRAQYEGLPYRTKNIQQVGVSNKAESRNKVIFKIKKLSDEICLQFRPR